MDNRGISPLIGYVLLIALGISMAGIVYSYLSFYVPKDNIQCPDDLGLIISEASCQAGELKITITNRGLFTADGVFIKIGDKSRIFRESLSNTENLDYEPFWNPQESLDGHGLKPGETWGPQNYNYTEQGIQELEIQPFIYGDDSLIVLCESAVITQDIDCS